MGVGEKPKHYDLADYVLGHFSKQEREVMEEGYAHAVTAVLSKLYRARLRRR